jgi:hypothetical protein
MRYRYDGDCAGPPPSEIYAPGVELCLLDHVPPKPFGEGYGPLPRDAAPVWEDGLPCERVVSDRVAFALDNPPIETQPPGGEQHTFTITGTKTLREFSIMNGGPNVVTGHIDGKQATVYVAKIYDGVYYPIGDCGPDRDCMLLADEDYALESWAYITMQAVEGVAAKLVPIFHGCWTFSLATNQPGRRRWVRMLVLGLVQGETMLAKMLRATENDVVRYPLLPPEQFRLRVFKNLFEAEISMWWDAEISHNDTEPRNVMVRDDGTVVLVDFNLAVVFGFFRWREHPKYLEGEPKLPVSPIRRYWPFSPVGQIIADPAHHGNPWANWIPESWFQNKELAAEWVLETWKDDVGKKYRALPDDFLNHEAHTQRSRKVLAMLEELGRKPADNK